jgi:polyisoprenoid-binding protein YceI
MKTFSQIRAAAVAAALLLWAGALSAQTLVRYDAQPGSKIKIDGTSTVHDWTVEGQIIGGFLELDPSFDFNSPKPGKVNAKVQATVPARSLRNSKNYKGMDERMHEALKVKEYPKIEYKLTELTLKEAKAGEPLRFDSKGELTVSGVTQTLSMPVTMEKQDGKLKTSGDLSLKMTSFKIDPPAPKVALGLISTGDDVKIRFEWLTAMPQKSADAK